MIWLGDGAGGEKSPGLRSSSGPLEYRAKDVL